MHVSILTIQVELVQQVSAFFALYCNSFLFDIDDLQRLK